MGNQPPSVCGSSTTGMTMCRSSCLDGHEMRKRHCVMAVTSNNSECDLLTLGSSTAGSCDITSTPAASAVWSDEEDVQHQEQQQQQQPIQRRLQIQQASAMLPSNVGADADVDPALGVTSTPAASPDPLLSPSLSPPSDSTAPVTTHHHHHPLAAASRMLLRKVGKKSAYAVGKATHVLSQLLQAVEDVLFPPCPSLLATADNNNNKISSDTTLVRGGVLLYGCSTPAEHYARIKALLHGLLFFPDDVDGNNNNNNNNEQQPQKQQRLDGEAGLAVFELQYRMVYCEAHQPRPSTKMMMMHHTSSMGEPEEVRLNGTGTESPPSPPQLLDSQALFQTYLDHVPNDDTNSSSDEICNKALIHDDENDHQSIHHELVYEVPVKFHGHDPQHDSLDNDRRSISEPDLLSTASTGSCTADCFTEMAFSDMTVVVTADTSDDDPRNQSSPLKTESDMAMDDDCSSINHNCNKSKSSNNMTEPIAPKQSWMAHDYAGASPVADCQACARRLFHIPTNTIIDETNRKHFIADGDMYEMAAVLCQEFAQDLMSREANLEWITLTTTNDDGREPIRAMISSNHPILLERKRQDRKGFSEDRDDQPTNDHASPHDHRHRTMLIVTGRGKVRAGIFSRQHLITSGLECATALPMIREACRRKCHILVLDPNVHGEVHGFTVFERSMNAIVRHLNRHNNDDNSDVNYSQHHLYCLFHSASGGHFARYLLDESTCQALLPHIAAVAFTDSTHNIQWAKTKMASTAAAASSVQQSSNGQNNKSPHGANNSTNNSSIMSQLYHWLESDRCVYFKCSSIARDGPQWYLHRAGQVVQTDSFWHHRFGNIQTMWAGTKEHSLANWYAHACIWNHFDHHNDHHDTYPNSEQQPQQQQSQSPEYNESTSSTGLLQ